MLRQHAACTPSLCSLCPWITAAAVTHLVAISSCMRVAAASGPSAAAASERGEFEAAAPLPGPWRPLASMWMACGADESDLALCCFFLPCFLRLVCLLCRLLSSECSPALLPLLSAVPLLPLPLFLCDLPALRRPDLCLPVV